MGRKGEKWRYRITWFPTELPVFAGTDTSCWSNLFSEAEVRILLDAVETGARVAENTRATSDASGKSSRLAIWHELGNDIWTAVSTCPRIVNNIRILLGEEVAFFHGKVMFKDAHEGGAWEWHQDYGYWYRPGVRLSQDGQRVYRAGRMHAG